MQKETENRIKGSHELNRMFDALARTAAGLRRDFGEVENLQQSLRGAADFVNKAAQRIEQMILSDLTLIRPHAGVLTPNMQTNGDGHNEYVLAFSGAANFIRANPHFAITLALRENGVTKIALIYEPISEKLYYAESGSGAFAFSDFHSTKIHASNLAALPDLTIATDNAAHAVLKQVPQINWRMTGCPALDLAGVASGKIDLMVRDAIDFAEIAAGELLISESMGAIWEQTGEIFASNKLIAKDIGNA